MNAIRPRSYPMLGQLELLQTVGPRSTRRILRMIRNTTMLDEIFKNHLRMRQDTVTWVPIGNNLEITALLGNYGFYVVIMEHLFGSRRTISSYFVHGDGEVGSTNRIFNHFMLHGDALSPLGVDFACTVAASAIQADPLKTQEMGRCYHIADAFFLENSPSETEFFPRIG